MNLVGLTISIVNILFIFLFGSVSSANDTENASKYNDVVIQTKFGYVRGIHTETASGFGVDAFRGIPFANKPERLKKARLVNNWMSVRNAQNYSAKCIPNIKPVNFKEYSEDCLYLNILTPSNRTKQVSEYPVVIFIHGGGFQEGDGQDASLDAFAENFVTQNIVVVTIQYRLAALGFLSLGCDSKFFSCNIGLWDQLLSFDFVNRTIDSFGGDRNNMTLFGHSAGAMSASVHSMSPISSRYFKKYIQLSGSAWGLTRFRQSNKDQTKKILESIDCDYTNRTQSDFYDCINNKSLEDFYFAEIDTSLWPEVGDHLFPDIPSKIAKYTKDQALFIGLQTLEALYFTYLKSDPAIFPYIVRPTVADYINSTIALEYGIDAQKANEMASAYFLPVDVPSNDYEFYMRQRTKIDSNKGFDIPVLREIREKLSFSSSIYAYHFEYFNPNEFSPKFPVKATYHCQEFPYIWGVFKDNKFDFDENDRSVSKFMVSSLVKFIQTGNPSSDGFRWPVTDEKLTHIRIQPQPVIEDGLFQDDYDFWDNMRKTFKYDLITGLPFKPTSGSSSAFSMNPALLIFVSLWVVFA